MKLNLTPGLRGSDREPGAADALSPKGTTGVRPPSDRGAPRPPFPGTAPLAGTRSHLKGATPRAIMGDARGASSWEVPLSPPCQAVFGRSLHAEGCSWTGFFTRWGGGD